MKQQFLVKFLSLLLIWTSLPASVMAQINICSSCGYEYDQADTFCSHCGKKIPKAVIVGPVEPAGEKPPSFESESPNLSTSAVLLSGEMKIIQNYMRENLNWEALIVARNARGLAMLGTRPDTGARDAFNLGISKLEAGLSRQFVPCRFCEGRGYPMALSLNMRGDKQLTAVPHVHCQACEGNKYLSTRPQADQVQKSYAAALNKVLNDFRQRGFKDAMGLWMPEALDFLSADPADQARALRSKGAECTTCQGLGSLGCEDCHGEGKLVCPNGNCVSGHEICPACKGTKMEMDKRPSRTVKQTCTACQGRGHSVCAECEGKGFIVCDECRGSGDVLCADCDGKGHAPLCDNCHGEGLADCSRCRGLGEYRGAPCTECQGRKKMVCEDCKGAGFEAQKRRRR